MQSYDGPWQTRRNDRLVWVKSATSAECKSIRIAASAVMDGWKGPTRHVGCFMVSKEKGFRRKQGGNKVVPGRYGFWVRMIGLGETISLISRKEKGLPLS